MKKELSKLLQPDHPLYTEAVGALKLYHQAQADGVVGVELERLRLMAERPFQAVTDYQLRALAIEMGVNGCGNRCLVRIQTSLAVSAED